MNAVSVHLRNTELAELEPSAWNNEAHAPYAERSDDLGSRVGVPGLLTKVGTCGPPYTYIMYRGPSVGPIHNHVGYIHITNRPPTFVHAFMYRPM